MKRLTYAIAPLLVVACAQDVLNTEPEVKIDPENVERSEPRNSVWPSPASGAKMSMKAGDVLAIHLDANPTTGLWWSDPEFDTSVIGLVDNDYIADPAPEGIVGSGGTTIFYFKATAPGKSRVRSEYSRGSGEVYDRLDITIEVSE